MKVALGSDHGGFELKNIIARHLTEKGHTVQDMGCFSKDSVDYPDFAVKVARACATGAAEIGVMIDGAGVGSAMAANKVPGVRAALCNDLYTARNAREHNNANMLVMGSMVLGPGKAREIVDVFLAAQFLGGRHARRVEKINALDGNSSATAPEATGNIQDIIQRIVQEIIQTSVSGTASQAGALNPPAPQNNNASPRLITEQWLRDQLKSGIHQVRIPADAIITPLARDFARDHALTLLRSS